MVLNFSRYFILIFLAFPLFISSQTIKGRVENNNGAAILSFSVIIKDSINSEIPNEFTIGRNGEYLIILKKNYKNISLEVTSNGYQKAFYEISNSIKEKIYIQNFELISAKVTSLKEVIILAEKKAFIIKEDTVKYNVSAYKDGSERKIQDIIKKLPGIKLNEKTGEITYKGKTVETVKLEGDDLFGSNYSLGAKNINVDLVEQVQAIENYSENPLLKGIENGDKVALNLKLKKGKVDFSGNIDFSGGAFDKNKSANDSSTNLLGISKRYKSFGTLSYNNIGQNNSPYDYFSNNHNVEQIKESSFFAKKIILESLFTSYLDDTRANINNQFFSNYNAIFKINPKISLKVNFYYLNDKIVSNQSSINTSSINDETLITSDNYEINKKPQLYRGDLELKINTSPTSLLEYKLITSQENISSLTNVIQNNTRNFQTILKSKSFFLKNKLLFTQKIADNKALQIEFIESIDKIPQELIINPSIFNNAYLKNIQRSSFNKDYLSVCLSFFRSTKNTKYSFTTGYITNSNPSQTSLSNSNGTSETIIDTYQNNFKFCQKSVYFSNNLNVVLGKVKLSSALKINLLSQDLENNFDVVANKTENIFFEPSLTLKYKINDISAVVSSLNYNVNPFAEEYLFSNPILINNRTSQSNTVSLDFQKSINVGTFYIINDLYKLFQLNLGLNYIQNKGNFFSDISLQEDNNLVNYFFLNKNSKVLNADFLIEKYISSIESTLRFKSNYSISTYKNIVNNSELRTNKNHFLRTELFIKTAFDVMVNFENVFSCNQTAFVNDDNKTYRNSVIEDACKIIVKPSKNWILVFSSDYFISDSTNKNKDYLFIDTIIRYVPKSKIIDFSIVAKNILNKNTFNQIQTTDYSTSTFQNNLLSRYFIIKVSYNL